MNKIGICGHFGFGCDLRNGQTVKTRHLAQALGKEFGEKQLFCVDTHGGAKNAPRVFARMIQMFRECTDVLFLPAYRGLLVLTPLFCLLNFFFRRRLHYIVIGGWLPQYLDRYRLLSRKLKKITGIYTETPQMKRALEERGFSNVWVAPNFRNVRPLAKEELVYTWTAPYPLCTFSRIIREKGIEDAVRAVILANERLGGQIFYLDIFGEVGKSYARRWETLERNFPPYIRYCGQAEPERIKNYYALLFPTYYSGEGFAGTLIDAMNAGVPVIASDWRYNRELVIPKETGALVPPREPEALADCLVQIAEDPEKWNGMKLTARRTAEQYAPARALEALIRNLAHHQSGED